MKVEVILEESDFHDSYIRELRKTMIGTRNIDVNKIIHVEVRNVVEAATVVLFKDTVKAVYIVLKDRLDIYGQNKIITHKINYE